MIDVRHFSKLGVLLVIVALSACSDPNRELLNQKVLDAETLVSALGNDLQAGKIRNAVILQEYAKMLRNERPELDRIITNLSREGTKSGQQYQFLKARLSALQKHTAQIGNPAQLLPEADALMLAANPTTYSQSLADPINVLADMSNGTLARVGVVSKRDEASYNDTKDYGRGSQMVGNPAYGQWNNNRGFSFWEFYGMYAMFNAITGSNRIYQRDWNRHRPYSYYQDVGVDRYGSSRERSKYRSSYSKSSGVKSTANEKRFSGARKSSSLGTGARSRSAGVSQRKPSSLSAKSSKSYGGSLRSSSTYTRSFRGGK